MADSFISYSRKDKVFVERLVATLQEKNHTVWIDWENIPLTADWMQEIEGGIESANNFIFVISPDSVASEVCQREIEYAVQVNKRLVPILHRELGRPEDRISLHPSISSHNWLFFREGIEDFNKTSQALLNILDTDLDYVRAHTRLLTRAAEWQRKDRDNSFLLRGSELREAIDVQRRGADKKPSITELQEDYINASIQAENWRKRERLLTGIISVAMVAALIAAGVALWQFREATQQRAIVQELSLAANSQVALTNNNRDLAIALGLEAVRIQSGLRSDGNNTLRVETENALADAAYSPGTRLVLQKHSNGVNAVVYSPDGMLALTGGADGTLNLWEALTGEPVHNFDGQHEGAVRDLIFSPDGERVISAGEDGTVRLWDTASGALLRQIDAHEGAVNSITTNPNGTTVLSGGVDNTMRVWDATNGELLAEFSNHDGAVMDVIHHPTEPIALTMALNTPPRTWDLVEEIQLRTYTDQYFSLDNLDVLAAAFSPDGSKVISTYGLNLMLWDFYSGAVLREFRGHGSYANSIAFSPDGSTIVSSARRENIIRIWSADSGEEVTRFEGHTNVVQDVAMRADGEFVMSGSSDGTVRVWQLTNGAQIAMYTAPQADIYSVDYAPDGNSFIVGGVDPIIYQIDRISGEIVRQFEGHTHRVWAVAFSPDGRYIFSGGDDTVVYMWDVASGEQLGAFEGHTANVTALDISSDGRWLLTGSDDRTVRLWDVATFTELQQYEDPSQLRTTQFSPDNTRMIVGGASGARVLTVPEGELVFAMVAGTDRVNTSIYSPDGRLIALGYGGARVRLWDAQTGALSKVLEGHTGQVRSVQFSQDNRRLLTSSADGTVRLWDVPSGLSVRLFEGHSQWVNQAVFSPDGNTALSGAWDETLRLWHIHSIEGLITWTEANRYTRPLTCSEQQIYVLSGQSCAEVQ